MRKHVGQMTPEEEYEAVDGERLTAGELVLARALHRAAFHNWQPLEEYPTHCREDGFTPAPTYMRQALSIGRYMLSRVALEEALDRLFPGRSATPERRAEEFDPQTVDEFPI
jgi:hypothetical protein